MAIEKLPPLTVIAVFAHPDDEFDVIGTLANHAERGDKVYVVFLTRGENASSIKGTPEEIMNVREGHARKIEKILGAHYRLLDLPDSAVETTIKNAKKLAEQFKELKPDIIITWGKTERIGAGHPDHRYTHDIVIDAISYARYKDSNSKYQPHRKAISLYTNYLHFSENPGAVYFVDVSRQFEKIMAVLDVYMEAYGNWPVKEYAKEQLAMYGGMCGVMYAEAYNKVLWRTAQQHLF